MRVVVVGVGIESASIARLRSILGNHVALTAAPPVGALIHIEALAENALETAFAVAQDTRSRTVQAAVGACQIRHGLRKTPNVGRRGRRR